MTRVNTPSRRNPYMKYERLIEQNEKLQSAESKGFLSQSKAKPEHASLDGNPAVAFVIDDSNQIMLTQS